MDDFLTMMTNMKNMKKKCYNDFEELKNAKLPGEFIYDEGSLIIKYKYTNGAEISITWLTLFEPNIKMIEIARIKNDEIIDILGHYKNKDEIIEYIIKSQPKKHTKSASFK